ncbi:hypothetical protein EGJ86_19525 [Pseudomonas sp. o96-267]|uniref:hypothetical protein n=1 Tax=Pseudomonas sp. o96-267 TaxID=2479853 RepID=UPI000F77C4A9|nr:MULTISPECIES: hypothetical protein [Pseudomonas]MDH0959044.1 hypothetical protein [Pseudomonas chengduensis]MDV5863650.1 hypothetical protein [Pseudomonas mendocina]RRV31764.1 hypothetical protein EGJ86_19525 [Pseudomonas sp. o96-267]
MKALPKIGVVLYADGTPFCREGNVACEYRKEPFEFSSASDLPGQTLWITNASLGDLIEAGLHKSPKIAHEGYYRSRIAQISQELGISKLNLRQQAAFLAETLGNAAEMARVHLGLTQYPSNGLANAVGQLFGVNEPAAGTASLQVAEQACQRYTACERDRRYEQADIFSFWMPRYQWAESLLAEPFPSGDGINAIPSHQLPSMGRDIAALVDWASAEKIPLFARVRIKGMEQTVGKLMNYGAGAQSINNSASGGARSYDARNMREWCALPELEVLSQVGDVDVIQVAVASGWASSGLNLYSSKLSRISYAYGIVAENLWVGLTRKPTPNGNTSRTLRTAWLQAVDRMRCLRVAERLYNMGMEVINYGNGRITVVCPQSVRALIPQAALEEGMLYPASLDGLQGYEINQQQPVHVMQHLITHRDYRRIIAVDQRSLQELGQSRET